jgi:hypothetical protein
VVQLARDSDCVAARQKAGDPGLETRTTESNKTGAGDRIKSRPLTGEKAILMPAYSSHLTRVLLTEKNQATYQTFCCSRQSDETFVANSHNRALAEGPHAGSPDGSYLPHPEVPNHTSR